MLLLVVAASCSELTEVQLDECDNGVLDKGEDCEPGFPDNLHTCVPAGLINECRFSCAVDPDGDGKQRLPCPPGWGCGVDEVCRKPSGSFSAPVSLALPPLQWLDVGDFNGDGNDDVVWSRDGFTRVHFMEDGAPATEVALARQSLTRPVIADLNKDQRADLLLPTIEGLAVYRGQTEETLLPTPFLSITIQPFGPSSVVESIRTLSVDVLPEVVWLNGEAMTDGRGRELLLSANIGILPEPTEVNFGDADLLLGVIRDVAVGELDKTGDPALYPPSAGTPEELVLVFGAPNQTVTQATVLRPRLRTVPDPDNPNVDLLELDFNDVDGGYSPVTLTTDDNIQRIAGLLHVNPEAPAFAPASAIPCSGGGTAPADEHLDVVLVTDSGLRVAFGVGNGTFHSDACTLNSVVADNQAVQLDLFDRCYLFDSGEEETSFDNTVLRVAQLDSDGLPDVVMSRGINFSRLLPPAPSGALSASVCSPRPAHLVSYELSPWLDAQLLDFNGDGILDVAALPMSGGLDVLTINAAGEGAYRNYPDVGRPEQLAVHDLDGDGVSDLAFLDNRQDGVDLLYVLFGEAYAPLGEPVAVAALEDLLAFGGGRVDGFDGVDDLLLLALGDDTADGPVLHSGTMLGRPDRQLQAPFQAHFVNSPLSDLDDELKIPLFAAVGDYRGDGSLQLALVGTDTEETVDAGDGVPFVLGAAAARDNLTLDMITPSPVAPPLMADLAQVQSGVLLRLDGNPDPSSELGKEPDLITALVSLETPPDSGTYETLVLTTAGAQDGDDVLLTPTGALAQVPNTRLLGLLPYDDDSDGHVASWAPHVSPSSVICNTGDPNGSSLLMLLQDMTVGTDSCGGGYTRLLQLKRDSSGKLLTYDEGTASPFSPGAGFDKGFVIVGYACIDAEPDVDDAGNEVVNSEIAVLSLHYGADHSSYDCNLAGAQVALARLWLLSTDAGVVATTPKLLAEFRNDGDDNAIGFAKVPNSVYLEEVEGLEGPADRQRPPMSGLAAGDFNGDGVDDLIVGAGGKSLLLLGQAVNP